MSAAVMAVFIPTLAWGSADARSARSAADAGFIAHDTDGPPFYYFQDASSTDAADNTVTIPVGGTVSFAYSTSGQSHNAYFVDGTPSSCTVDSGPFPAGPAAVPQYPVPGPWSGSCRFATAGTYRFVCQAHTAMDGIVVVEATPTATATATQSPTPTATETATVAPTQTPTATPPPVVVAATPSPTASPAPQPFAKLSQPASLKLKTFAGRGLKASGGCTAGGSGKLALTISRAAAKQLKLKGTTLATGTAKCDGSGRMTATLKPGAAAKKALKRQRKALATTLTLTVGSAKASVKVTLK